MEKQQIEEIVSKQKRYFDSGITFDLKNRREALKSLYSLLNDNEERIAVALKADLGKARMEAYMCETGLAKAEISHMLKNLTKYSRERLVKTPLAQFASRSFVKPVPYGNVLIMSPWNYPLLLSIDPLADAIAAGNTAVLKPSAYAPETSKLLKELIEERFDEEYIAVITGGRAENSALLDIGFDKIFFTGSKAVGKEVLRKAAEHLTPVTLELGGKSPCIVDKTADIMLAAKRIVFGKMLNCGQTCVAPDYIYCDESIRAELIKELKKQLRLQYGKDILHSEDYGKIINKRHFERICGLIDTSLKSGGKLEAGGGRDEEALKIEPTIISCVSWNSAVMGEEIFGPVLPVMSFGDLKEAAAQINKREHPLALYIFSSDKNNIDFIKSRVQFGGGCINDTIIHLATSEMGFGGVGESGMGAYHGRAGFDAFSHRKSIVDKKTFMDLPMRYRPYKKIYEKMLHIFLR